MRTAGVKKLGDDLFELNGHVAWCEAVDGYYGPVGVPADDVYTDVGCSALFTQLEVDVRMLYGITEYEVLDTSLDPDEGVWPLVQFVGSFDAVLRLMNWLFADDIELYESLSIACGYNIQQAMHSPRVVIKE